ncbi:MAG: urease accessory protein UreE [Aphanocapsa sp. GSE-SYN-MK-11-07L]|jgi:urease accessory protein|nr:urease accessory protein UreE [Aphanocapsa sp. GSE-SYN-MK-11-07L]
MLTLTARIDPASAASPNLTLSLTAEQRTRSRHRFRTEEGEEVHLHLPRGTVLTDGDWLRSQPEGTIVKIIAKPEPVLTVTGKIPLDLLRAAYHLGNRHVALEVTASYLRLLPDSVLQTMIEQMGLDVQASVQPFLPETGAYHRDHAH